MLASLQALLSILGRVCLCIFFLHGTFFDKIPQFSSFVRTMRAERIPYPRAMLSGMIIFTIVGSLLVILGYKSRLGAFLLLVFLVVGTYYSADFWNLSLDMQSKQLQFIKNASLAGALLMIMANGTGAGSLERGR